MTFQEIFDAKFSAVLEKYEAFFSFGKDERIEANPDRYVHMGMGLVCPKEHTKDLREEIDQIHAQAVKEHFESVCDESKSPAWAARKICEYSYWNYETHISLSGTDDYVESLQKYVEAYPKYFTPERIASVANQCWKKACANDWF